MGVLVVITRIFRSSFFIISTVAVYFIIVAVYFIIGRRLKSDGLPNPSSIEASHPKLCQRQYHLLQG